jgi:hypothetical protein
VRSRREEVQMKRIRRLAIRMITVTVVAGIMVAGLSVVSAPAAHAYSYSNRGCAGSQQFKVLQGYNLGGLYATFPARTVPRSPCYASSTQLIYIRYRLWQKDGYGNWLFYKEQWFSVSVIPGYQANMPAWGIGSLYRHLNADVYVEWRTTGDVFIGSQFVDYVNLSDYTCSGCFVRTDPVVGAYITLGW